MSRGFNKVIIMGNLAKDPDVRYTPSQQKVARMTVAVGSQWKNKQTGELQSHVDFIPVVAWRFTADICEKYLKKGSPVLVEGRLSVRDFDDARTGTHRWVTEVVCDNLTLLPKRDGEAPRPAYQPPAAPAAKQDFHADVASLRDDKDYKDYGDDFPMDISEFPGGEEGDADIPF